MKSGKKTGFVLFAAAVILPLCGPVDAQAPAPEKKAAASASGATSTQASASAGKQNAQLSSDSTFEATLTKPVDVKKNKAGDPVEARARHDVKSDGQVVIPKGSKLVGHVTESKARAKGQNESQLGIAFDKAVMKDGREVPLAVVIQAVAASEASANLARDNSADALALSQPSAGRASGAPNGGGGGGLVGGVTSTAGATVGSVAGAAGSTTGATLGSTGAASGNSGGLLSGTLSSTTNGVVGMRGLSLLSEASSATSAQGSLLSSTTQDVRLESGTRFLLRAVQK